MLALSASGISKTYKNSSLLSFLDLSLEEGKIHALVGPKGCGKETAANIFCGIISPTRGSCSFFDTSLKDTKNAHNICGLSNSKIELYPYLTGIDNLTLIASLFGIDKDTARQRASSLMKELDIWQYHETLYKDYSDTSKKLLSLSRAMLHNPKILFLEKNKEDDNPKYNKILTDFIKNHTKEDNLTVCLVTDDIKFASENASSFTVLNRGKTVCSGTTDELLEKYPLKTYVKIKSTKKPEGFSKSKDFWIKEISDKSEFSKILLDNVLAGIEIQSAEILSPDFEAIYNRITEEVKI